ncbi:hypothetical protein ACFTZB_35800 [Rhodococcus sp. NPDC057014]|uniref:hypothetical protein n=1 Tax=Rhodococcus sp. NPDC057014 TaxID=3346000 RepID=UPI0036259FDF
MTTAARPFASEPARNSSPTAPTPRRGTRLSDAAIMFGALSIVTFWLFGFGIILGGAALVTGGLSLRRPDATGNESTSLEALLGMLAGVFGIAAGLMFLVCALPHF